MQLKRLSLLNYRNAARGQYTFDAPVVSLTGPNGTGKTNVLDAIHYLCLSKSYFSQQDQQLVRFGEDFFNLDADILQNEREIRLFCAWQGGKKLLKNNGVTYERLADHIGRFPVVMVAPTDLDLIYDSSEIRRRFADMLLSQTDHDYLLVLMRYNKLLQQKQAMLRQLKTDGRFDNLLFDILTEQLEPLNLQLSSKRAAWLDQFNPLFENIYRTISGNREAAGISYEHLSRPELTQTQKSKQEQEAGRCLFGIHRDELHFTLDGQAVRRFGSQGQQKSFLISLKLAQAIYLSEHCGQKPFLLLDDIFEKLDGSRISSLLRLVQEDRFGQIFLTDTDRKRVEAIFGTGPHIQYIELHHP